MEAPPSLVRLAIGGLLLDPRAYQAQRDNPTGWRRGLVLVLLVGLLVGLATMLGDLGEYLTQPDAQLFNETLYRGLTEMPWYAPAVQANPEIATLLDQLLVGPGAISLTPTPAGSVLTLVLSPLIGLVSWFIGGAFVHIAARAFGGVGSFAQTLAVYAVAYGVNLLGLVQVVPYAEAVPGSLLVAGTLLGLISTYVAVRETHGLPPWRSFWAVLIGPLLLTVLLGSVYCCLVFVLAGVAGGGA